MLGVVLAAGSAGVDALDVVGEPIAVWDDDEENFPADVVHNPTHDEYLVLFCTHRGASIDIYARRVAGDGTVLSWFAVAAGAGEEHLDARAAYSAAHDEYLVVWTRQQDTGTKDDVLARTVSWNGGLLGPVFTVVGGADHQRAPDVAYNPANDEYLVVYHNQWAGGFEDVAAQRIRASDLAFLSWANIATGSGNRHYPRVAYSSAQNSYLIAYTLDQNGVYAKLASSDLSGVSIAPEIVIRYDAEFLISDRVGIAAGPGGYLVAWDEVHLPTVSMRSARARRVNHDGAPQGPVNGFLVSDTMLIWNNTDSVGVGSGLSGHFVLAWRSDDPVGFYDVEAGVVVPETDTIAVGPIALSTEEVNQYVPAIDCATVGSCLVAYADDYTHGIPPQADNDIRARLFSPVVFSDRFETGDTAAWSSSVP
jgi:hypothetical protein